MKTDPIIDAHKHSIWHLDEIRNSAWCGCFHCLYVFRPETIKCWTDDDTTALCPRCRIDSVIGDASGYSVRDRTFLKAMQLHWFGEDDEEDSDVE